jgi:hypothetical protein
MPVKLSAAQLLYRTSAARRRREGSELRRHCTTSSLNCRATVVLWACNATMHRSPSYRTLFGFLHGELFFACASARSKMALVAASAARTTWGFRFYPQGVLMHSQHQGQGFNSSPAYKCDILSGIMMTIYACPCQRRVSKLSFQALSVTMS